MTTTPTIWLEEFLSNLITADAQSNPKVISLANGNFLVAWVDDNDTVASGSGTDIVGVIFDPLGNPVSDSLYLNLPFGFSREEDQVDIAATPDGGFVAVYRFPLGDETDFIFGRYDADGNRTASGFIVNDTAGDPTYGNPSIAVADDGSFFVTYEYTNGADNDIRGVKVSAANVVSPEFILRADGFSNGADLEDTEGPHTVLLTNGNFATVFTENDNNAGVNERTVEVRISNADGSNFTLISNVTTPDALPDSDARIAALADGRFVVMWREGGNHMGRIFNNDGSESVAAFTISNNSALDFDGAEIIGLEDSSFVVALIDETQGRLFIIRYNDNVVDGGSRILSIDASGTGGNITNLSMDLTGDGRILLSWENGEIYTEILDPRDAGSFNAEVDDGATTDRQGESTTITGTADNDTIYGLDGSDTLIGDTGNDILTGGTGNDTLIGGADGDMLDGGDDIDTVSYIGSSSGVTVDLENNTASGGDAEGDTIANFENVIGSDQNDILTGSDMNNELAGGSGDDILRGGIGDDLLDGGADNDTASFADATGSGVTVDLTTAGPQAVGGGLGNDTLVDIENLIGSQFADMLTGSGGINIIAGGAGGDMLDGGDDIDTLDYSGSSGGVTVDLENSSASGGDAEGDTIANFENVIGSDQNDILTGSDMNNELIGGAGDDILRGGIGDDLLDGGADNDTASFADATGSGVTVDLTTAGPQAVGGGLGNDTLVDIENLIGSQFADMLTGSGGINIIAGGAGADILDGGFGSDVLDYSASDAAVTVVLGGSSAPNSASGGHAQGDIISNFTSIIGSDHDDVLTTVFASSDVLIDGGDGNDTFDLSIFAVGGFNLYWDLATGYRGSGNFTDPVQIAFTSIENFIGQQGIDRVRGTAEANFIDGQDGGDFLEGLGGDDILRGGIGDDLLDGGADNDTASFADATGSGVTVDLTTAGPQAVGGGLGNDTLVDIENLIGSQFADMLTGDGGANVIDGGNGGDILQGGLGNDILDGGSGTDTASYADAGSGVRVKLALQSVSQNTQGGGRDTLISIERLVGSSHDDVLRGDAGNNRIDGGAGNDRFNAGSGNDLIFGDAGDDVIEGAAGDDTMRGGLGNDSYTIRDAGDLIIENADEGIDSVKSHIDYTLGNNVETLSLVGGARVGTGNDLNNTIFGRGGGDTLSGLAGNDIIRGNNAADIIDGGTGNDLIDGGQGKDIMTGGADQDRFQFRFASDFNATRNTADVIDDFNQGEGDDIQLNAIDADTSTGTNDSFEWIATNAFSNTAGEMRYQQIAGDTFIEGDTDGDGQADLMIRLTGLHTLDATDIIGVSDLQANSTPVSAALMLSSTTMFGEGAFSTTNIANMNDVLSNQVNTPLSEVLSSKADTAVSASVISADDVLSVSASNVSDEDVLFTAVPAAAFESAEDEGGSPRLDHIALFDAPMPEAVSVYLDNII